MNKIRNYLDVLDLDPRILSIVRILLSAFTIIYLLPLWEYLPDFFSHNGLMNESLYKSLLNEGNWSFFQLYSSLTFVKFLFIILFLSLVSLAVGFKSKASSIIAWTILQSLLIRNKGLESNLTLFISSLLFWNIFLPSHYYFSLDFIKKPKNIKNSRLLNFSFILFCSSVFLIPAFIEKKLLLTQKTVLLSNLFSTGINVQDIFKESLFWIEMLIPLILLFSKRWWRNFLIATVSFFYVGMILQEIHIFHSIFCLILILHFIHFTKGFKVKLQSSTVINTSSFFILPILVLFTITPFIKKKMPQFIEITKNLTRFQYTWKETYHAQKEASSIRVLGTSKEFKHYDLLSTSKDDYFDNLGADKNSLYLKEYFWTDYFNFIMKNNSNKDIIRASLSYFCRKEKSIKEVDFVFIKHLPNLEYKEKSQLKINCF